MNKLKPGHYMLHGRRVLVDEDGIITPVEYVLAKDLKRITAIQQERLEQERIEQLEQKQIALIRASMPDIQLDF